MQTLTQTDYTLPAGEYALAVSTRTVRRDGEMVSQTVGRIIQPTTRIFAGGLSQHYIGTEQELRDYAEANEITIR
jgi:hypothetical protein